MGTNNIVLHVPMALRFFYANTLITRCVLSITLNLPVEFKHSANNAKNGKDSGPKTSLSAMSLGGDWKLWFRDVGEVCAVLHPLWTRSAGRRESLPASILHKSSQATACLRLGDLTSVVCLYLFAHSLAYGHFLRRMVLRSYCSIL